MRVDAAVRGAASNHLYWGVAINAPDYGSFSNPAPSNMASVAAYELVSAKKVSVLHWGSSFKNSDGSTNNFNATHFTNCRNRGVIPWYTWQPQQSGGGATQPAYTLAAITAGNWDSYITTWATAAKAWGYPFFLRFMHEMNGSWYPWGVGANGNARTDFVPAWQHVHDIFTSVGATNVTWVWCPNQSNSLSISGLYPGDSYVDWVFFDAYYDLNATKTKAVVYEYTYNDIYTYASGSIPCGIGETASGDSASRVSYINEMLGAFGPATSMPNVRCLLYFNETDSSLTAPAGLWRIDSPPSPDTTKRDAFRSGISDAKYLTSDNSGYSSLATLTKVPVPA